MNKKTKPNTKINGTNGLDEGAIDAREMRRAIAKLPKQPAAVAQPVAKTKTMTQPAVVAQPVAKTKTKTQPAAAVAQPKPKREHRPCEHCGRLNTHGGNCRTAAACLKRRQMNAAAAAAQPKPQPQAAALPTRQHVAKPKQPKLRKRVA